MAKRKTILEIRTKAIQDIIKDEIDLYLSKYLGKVFYRRCATCGKKFIPKMRWHFFCMSDCRKYFYAGQFKRRFK